MSRSDPEYDEPVSDDSDFLSPGQIVADSYYKASQEAAKRAEQEEAQIRADEEQKRIWRQEILERRLKAQREEEEAALRAQEQVTGEKSGGMEFERPASSGDASSSEDSDSDDDWRNFDDLPEDVMHDAKAAAANRAAKYQPKPKNKKKKAEDVSPVESTDTPGGQARIESIMATMDGVLGRMAEEEEGEEVSNLYNMSSDDDDAGRTVRFAAPHSGMKQSLSPKHEKIPAKKIKKKTAAVRAKNYDALNAKLRRQEPVPVSKKKSLSRKPNSHRTQYQESMRKNVLKQMAIDKKRWALEVKQREDEEEMRIKTSMRNAAPPPTVKPRGPKNMERMIEKNHALKARNGAPMRNRPKQSVVPAKKVQPPSLTNDALRVSKLRSVPAAQRRPKADPSGFVFSVSGRNIHSRG